MAEETIEQETARKIAEAKAANPDLWYVYFFNNFPGFLPGGTMHEWTDLHSKITNRGGRPQIFRNFLRECESAVYEAGTTPEDIKKAREEHVKNRSSTSLWNIITPVYVALRKKGYSHDDLWT